jgi:hypothetical protein
VPFCQLLIATTIIVVIVRFVIVIITIVSIHHPSSTRVVVLRHQSRTLSASGAVYGIRSTSPGLTSSRSLLRSLEWANHGLLLRLKYFDVWFTTLGTVAILAQCTSLGCCSNNSLLINRGKVFASVHFVILHAEKSSVLDKALRSVKEYQTRK